MLLFAQNIYQYLSYQAASYSDHCLINPIITFLAVRIPLLSPVFADYISITCMFAILINNYQPGSQ
jgi:hypothetical protein